MTDPPALLGPAEATSGALRPVLGSSVRERHGAPGEESMEARKDDLGSLMRETEGAGAFSLEKTEGRAHQCV